MIDEIYSATVAGVEYEIIDFEINLGVIDRRQPPADGWPSHRPRIYTVYAHLTERQPFSSLITHALGCGCNAGPGEASRDALWGNSNLGAFGPYQITNGEWLLPPNPDSRFPWLTCSCDNADGGDCEHRAAAVAHWTEQAD